jgi:[protein-PII] uridylyltransferase
MSSDLENVSPSVLPLEIPGDRGSTETTLDTLRRLLKLEAERLRMRHRGGLGGAEIARERSELVDVVVRRACQIAESFAGASAAGEMAVVALGGYGRRELAPFSDVDLLFLAEDRATVGSSDLVGRVLALLWDVGLTVRHSYRSVPECLEIARRELVARTALTEARLIGGSPSLFRRLPSQMDGLVAGSVRAQRSLLEALRMDLASRYARHGHAVCVQEPHIKEGAGGLRDLHVVLWVAHARFGALDLASLLELGKLGESEYAVARRSYEYLTRVRHEAHFVTGRKTDLLSLDLQKVVAENLGYRPGRGRLASEWFMSDYYQRAAALHRFSRTFLTRHAGPLSPRRTFASLLRRRARGTFEIREGALHSRGEPRAPWSAPRALEAFTLAQNEGLDLSEELKLDIHGCLDLVDRRFRASPEASRAFQALLRRPGRVGRTLRAMHETGFLARFLPEVARITFLVQHDHCHRYTVDEHTLRSMEALDAVATEEATDTARLRQVLSEVGNPTPLYLGLLFHHLGKAHGGSHVARSVHVAEKLCARLGVSPRVADDARFLVGAQLEMSEISQRRDLSESSLIESFARRVGTLERLNMLLLLTYADQRAVGPGNWTEWKASLLWDLYEKARHHLTAVRPGPWADDRMTIGWWKARRQLHGESPEDVARYFELMPERYLRAHDGPEMVRHFRLLRRLREVGIAVEWRTPPEAHFTELAVATRDRPGLLATLAGTLTAHGIDILSADLCTREDELVLDIFKVRGVVDHRPVPRALRSSVEASLEAALDGRYDVAAAVEQRRREAPPRTRRRPPAPPAVRFEAGSSATRTVLEVRAEDEPGLAFRIASTLSACGLDIDFAKVATEKGQALDIFYVTAAGGRKLDADECRRVEGALLEGLATGR